MRRLRRNMSSKTVYNKNMVIQALLKVRGEIIQLYNFDQIDPDDCDRILQLLDRIIRIMRRSRI